MSHVTVQCGGRAYAFDLAQVREAIDLEYLTPVPTAPAVIAGVVNLRGEVVPVLNLGALLEHTWHLPQPGDVLLVVEAEAQRVAFAVDRVSFVSAGKDGPVDPAIERLDARVLMLAAAEAVAGAGQRLAHFGELGRGGG